MKRRVEQLLNEIFEYETPEIVLSKKEIRFDLPADTVFRGDFTLENSAQKKMKGFLYSSNIRVAYHPVEFSGIDEKIIYEVDTTGMEDGDEISGFFSICSNIGEYSLPYHFRIQDNLARMAGENGYQMEEFVELARENFQKAYLYFISDEFKRMINRQAPEYICLYEGIKKESVSYRSLEEFLTGAGKKEPVKIEISQQRDFFEKVNQTFQESIILTRSGWGFLCLEISADAPFLKVERPVVTTDEFIGSTYTLDYLIDKEELHAGVNMGRITIKSQVQILTFEVVVHQRKRKDRKLYMQHVQEAALFAGYINFRLNKTDINTWIRNSEESLRKYYRASGSSIMMKLYQVQLLFAAEKEKEACLLLEEIDGQKEKLKKPELMGYYLYLTTFHHKDPKYVDYIEEQVHDLFRQDQENWKLQWILLYLQERMVQHPEEKLEAIREQYLYGCRSRIMYLEAYYVIAKNPVLLKRLDDFEIQILNFITREDLLTKDIALQVSEAAGRQRTYSDGLYRILGFCYEKYQSKDIVSAVCSLLIKGHKTGTEYFIWYELGVEAGLRMNGLYEFYIESMGEREGKPLPQIIKMYFSYNNTLGHIKKASVYANVIRNRKLDEQVFQSYRPTMEKFMVDQLSAGRINRDLGLLYQTFLTKALMNRQMAKALGRVLFTYEIYCDSPIARAAVVVHRYLKEEQRVPLQKHTALVQIYTEDYQVFLEDQNGLRYAVSIPYTLTPVMTEPGFMKLCQELAPASPGLVLYACGKAESRQSPEREDIEAYQNLLQIEEVKESYKKQIRSRILDYYYENQEDEILYEYLHKIDFEPFLEADKKKLIELLISSGMTMQAYELICDYGPEKVSPGALVRLCSRVIYDQDFEEDEMLVSHCFYCFIHQKYNETILSYLVKYYDGPVAYMKALWEAAGRFEVDAFPIEEKILVYILFLGDGVQESEEIFDDYRRKLGKKKIIRAYVIYCCYEYFVRENPVKQLVFDYLERESMKGELEEVCRLGLLKYYSAKYILNEQQEEFVQSILDYYVHEGIHMKLFQQFDKALVRALQIHDKTIIEYRTNPEAKVSLSFYIERAGGERSSEMIEPMQNMYEGIFVKEFVLFYGDRLVYHVMEDVKGKEKKTDKITLDIKNSGDQDSRTGFDLLNQISKYLYEHQDEKAREEIRIYQEQEKLVNELFTLS